MVYVFCVQTATDHESHDPFRLDQWKFHVVPRSKIAELGQKSVGINRVQSLSGGETRWTDLAVRVAELAVGERLDAD